MVTTKVVNDTDSEIDVKEGNVGVYIPLQTLSKKGSKNSSCTITVDTNATYREYWIAALADNSTGRKPIVVTSDDCIDNSILTIKFDDKEKEYFCHKTARNHLARSATSTGTASSRAPPKGWKERFFGLFSTWRF
ncbi:hypothetical protein M758_1G006500 [Ceratodon purpureus]|uniref:DUF7748 domain-containing protein n=1 Tax=Ceratodon purpureus TaxID=3225 RepID=A0A8T0J3B7_CERPU|nr:hypothetical protein KC19_1G007600 [Ceratodon purpureus]KAG0628176.1 hypothetical protein M758_1G006500 [Ceratodon purpureus]